MTEAELIALLRPSANDPGARGLIDDVAVLAIGGRQLVLTHDMIVEGVHYLAGDAPADVAWKLLSVNLSDLAAKGARPVGVLLGYMLGEDQWDRAFAAGMNSALAAFDLPLLGGDTVQSPPGSPRMLGLTAVGESQSVPPSRSGACPGDGLWVTGSIGDSGAGLALLRRGQEIEELSERYRNPRPRLEGGQRLAPIVNAMMDVSDGLLLDASRMAEASGCALSVELDSVPLSEAYVEAIGEGRSERLDACTAGDDYELLFAAAPGGAAAILKLAEEIGLPCSRIGRFEAGRGLSVDFHGETVELPDRLGFEHRA